MTEQLSHAVAWTACPNHWICTGIWTRFTAPV